jgi:hypothetical protein
MSIIFPKPALGGGGMLCLCSVMPSFPNMEEAMELIFAGMTELKGAIC